MGERWVNLSYDYLFRFNPRSVTNNVVLILMDQDAHAQLHQVRGEPWDRGLHAELLKRLAADNCPLVVFDSFFWLYRAKQQRMRRWPRLCRVSTPSCSWRTKCARRIGTLRECDRYYRRNHSSAQPSRTASPGSTRTWTRLCAGTGHFPRPRNNFQVFPGPPPSARALN